MKIGTHALAPKDFSHHLQARAHKKEKTRRNLMATLTLTAMVDMFAVLVIFLLQSFSASPELLITKGLELPIASTGAELKDAPVLSLAGDGVYLDQKFVGETAKVLLQPDSLIKQLGELREKWQRANSDKPFPGEINLQADKEVASSVVSQFMAMVSSEHYGSILLAVVAGSNK